MPEYYADWWYEDMPPAAKKAAEVMGYTKETWDKDEKIPYDDKAIHECGVPEKKAALYLGMNPIAKKCDIWWSELSEESQKMALALGWTKEKWDDDWELHHLEIEHKYWAELTDDEKEAAAFFGYMQSTWDQTDEIPTAFDGPAAKKPTVEEEKKEDDDEPEKVDDEAVDASDDDTADEEEEVAAPAKTSTKKTTKKKKAFKMSKAYGGGGGAPFDHRNHRSVQKITIVDDVPIMPHVVAKLEIVYSGGQQCNSGSNHPGRKHTLEMAAGEYVNCVKVRSNKIVQSLEFLTNKGNSLKGGGKGWMLPGKDKAGELITVKAPIGYQLCGLKGKAGSYIDAIAFRWGPVK